MAALDLAASFQPDVVILDIGMPGMNGYMVAQRLRQDPATASAALVALSGLGQQEDKARAAEAGFDRHFTKPVDVTRAPALPPIREARQRTSTRLSSPTGLLQHAVPGLVSRMSS